MVRTCTSTRRESSRSSPRNIVATRIAHDAGLSLGDWIAGPVVAVGRPDNVGFDTPVPERFLKYVESLGCQIDR